MVKTNINSTAAISVEVGYVSLTCLVDVDNKGNIIPNKGCLWMTVYKDTMMSQTDSFWDNSSWVGEFLRKLKKWSKKYSKVVVQNKIKKELSKDEEDEVSPHTLKVILDNYESIVNLYGDAIKLKML